MRHSCFRAARQKLLSLWVVGIGMGMIIGTAVAAACIFCHRLHSSPISEWALSMADAHTHTHTHYKYMYSFLFFFHGTKCPHSIASPSLAALYD